MRITSAEAADLVDVIALERDTAEAPHWAEAAYHAMVMPDEGSVRRCLLVSHDGGRLMGFAVGKVVGPEADLESVVVQTSARRSGVGKALCKALLAWSWNKGGLKMALEVRASSAGAIALYTSLGFQVVGSRRGYYTAPTEDAMLMQLERPAES